MLKVKVISCPRCEMIHEEVLFSALMGKDVLEKYSYWGLCPTLKEPILMDVSSTNNSDYKILGVKTDK